MKNCVESVDHFDMVLKFVRVVCILVIVDMAMVSKIEAKWFGWLSPPNYECSDWKMEPLDRDCNNNPGVKDGKREVDKQESRCCNKQSMTKICQ